MPDTDCAATAADRAVWLRRLSLRTRLAALAAAGSVVVLGVAAPLLYQDLSSALGEAITNELAIRVDDLSTNFRDSSVGPGSALVTAQLVDSSGEILSPPGADPLLTADELAHASQGLIIVDRPVPDIGEQARVLARPLGGTGADVVVGVAATSTEPLARARDRLVVVLAVAGPVLVGGVGAAAWLLTGAALRPVRRMAREATTISAAAAGRRLPSPANDDEIAELGRTLNAMLDRIESTIAHERAFIDNAAHEMRTPIAVLRGELELATHDVGDPRAVRRSLASALEETDRLTRRTENLLTLARADAGQITPGDATTELLVAARAGVRRLPHRDHVGIEVRGEPAAVRGDPEWLSHIVSNLVANAVRHARSRVLITVTTADARGRLAVSDDGPGFPSELLPHAFDRFARGDEARGRAEAGAGLGLAIVASLTQAMGGAVSARNGPPLGGAHVEVDIPLARHR